MTVGDASATINWYLAESSLQTRKYSPWHGGGDDAGRNRNQDHRLELTFLRSPGSPENGSWSGARAAWTVDVATTWQPENRPQMCTNTLLDLTYPGGNVTEI